MSRDSELAERLEELAAPAPASGFDLERAMAEGLRARRRRTLVFSAWSVAVVLACSVGIAVVAGRAGGSMAGPPTGYADTEFPANDPLQVGAQFGWLPSGIKADDTYSEGGISSDDGAWQGANMPGRLMPGRTLEGVALRTLPADLNPQQAASVMDADLGSPAITVQQDPINGRPAYWVVGENTPADLKYAAMIWRLADGRWGGLAQTALPSGEAVADMRHIAETVTVGSRPRPMPLRVSALPKGASVTDLRFSTPGLIVGAPWQADLTIRLGNDYFAFTVAPPGYANLYNYSTPEGMRFAVGPTQCETVNGLEACVSQSAGKTVPAALSTDGLKGLLKYLTLMGPDRGTWTTDVVHH